MSAWELPETVTIGNTEYAIRYQFGAILDILSYFNNPNYENDEQWIIALNIFYIDFETIPREYIEDACKALTAFIDAGIQSEDNKPSIMDWEQDAPLIIPAVNRVIGHDVRRDKDLHWWTFIGAYMEIGESLFSSVLSIRAKKRKNKKLEKNEREFYLENRHLIDLKKHLTDAEEEQRRAEEEAIKELIGG